MRIVRSYHIIITLAFIVFFAIGCEDECLHTFITKQEIMESHSHRRTCAVDDVLETYAIDARYRTEWPIYNDIEQLTSSTVGGDFDADVYVDKKTHEKYLVFCSTRHGNYPNIYMKKTPSLTVEMKTHGFDANIQPRFSPDGSRIAYASRSNGNWDIFIMNTHGVANPMQLTRSDSQDIFPSWSPDGKRIAYMALAGISRKWELRVINLDGTGNFVIGKGYFPQWSPDGKKLLFQRPRGTSQNLFAIWTVNLDGTELTEIVASDKWAAIDPAWSPDGQHIVFASVCKSPLSRFEGRLSQGDDIWIVRSDGSDLTQVTTNPAPDWNPTWAQDNRIYFTSERSGHPNIWAVKPFLGKN